MDATAVIGLDPVDQPTGDAAAAASSVTEPTLILLGEPGTCNSNANGAGIAAKLGGSPWTVQVTDATHCDFESDTDGVCTVLCGKNDAGRQSLIDAYAIGWALHYTVGGADDWLEAGKQTAADRSAGKISW
jgi:hypothetical protein